MITAVTEFVGTDATACECGERMCYFCGVKYDEWLAEWEVDIEAMGLGCNCERCCAVDRRHCFTCKACPGQAHAEWCEGTHVIVPSTMEIILGKK